MSDPATSSTARDDAFWARVFPPRDSEELLRALRAAGHRLHVMAVGDAGESLWRELAEASGGAFELLG